MTRSPGSHDLEQRVLDLLLVLHVAHRVVAVRVDRVGERLARRARDGRLAGRVDVGDDEHVGLVEGARELLEERLRARVAVRLEGDDDAAVEARLRGVERRLDLGGVVAVVVDDHHVAGLALASVRLAEHREAALHAAERGDRVARDVERDLELVGDGDDGEAFSTLCAPGMRTMNSPSGSSRRYALKCVSRPSNADALAR